MKKHMMTKVITSIICAVILCIPAVSVYANSAQTRWSGVDATGTMITDETGYTLNLSGLPETELEFTLSTSENPVAPQYSGVSGLVEEILYTFLGVLVLGFIALIIGIMIIIKFIKKKRGRQ